MTIADQILKASKRTRLRRSFRWNLKAGGSVAGFAGFVIDAKAMRQLDVWERKVLYRTGGFARTIIRRSIKKRPKKKGARRGRAGKAPYYTPGQRDLFSLKGGIIFQVDEARSAVRVGTTKFKTSTTSRQPSTTMLLERGGPARTEILKHDHGELVFVRVKARYDPHPFVGPRLPRVIAEMAKIIQEERIDQ